VLLAVRQELGIETDLIPRIASAFGVGIGGRGEVCGAVSGGAMAIGLKHGREEPWQSRDQAFALAQELCRRFEEEMGSIHCRQLTGMDLSTPEGLQAYRNSDVPVRVCLRATGIAFEAVRELLELPSQGGAAD
jgi:C_GCAxxG_C_C family probable redox protein